MENQNQNSGSGQQTINIQVPSADNIASRRSLIPASFALVIILFFFTFCDLKCGREKIGSATGFDLVTGTELKDRDMFTGKEKKGKDIPANIWAIFAFSAAIVGLGAFLIKEKRESLIGTGAGAIGFGSLLILQFSIKSAIEEEADGKLEVAFQFPYWGALIALGVAGIISYLRMQKTHKIIVSVSPPTSTTPTTENITQPQSAVSSILQTSNFDIQDWLSQNKKIVIGIIALGIAFYSFYHFFLINDPSKDGQTAAMALCNCEKVRIERLKSFFIELDKNTRSITFENKTERDSIRYSIESKSESFIKLVYDAELPKCKNEAQEKYTKLKEKYITNGEFTEKFDYAFNAQQGLCKIEDVDPFTLSGNVVTRFAPTKEEIETETQRIADSIATVEQKKLLEKTSDKNSTKAAPKPLFADFYTGRWDGDYKRFANIDICYENWKFKIGVVWAGGESADYFGYLKSDYVLKVENHNGYFVNSLELNDSKNQLRGSDNEQKYKFKKTKYNYCNPANPLKVTKTLSGEKFIGEWLSSYDCWAISKIDNEHFKLRIGGCKDGKGGNLKAEYITTVNQNGLVDIKNGISIAFENEGSYNNIIITLTKGNYDYNPGATIWCQKDK